jgi:hypothetical protein
MPNMGGITLDLQDKIALTRNYLDQIYAKFGPDKIAVAWTMGKDSTTVHSTLCYGKIF